MHFRHLFWKNNNNFEIKLIPYKAPYIMKCKILLQFYWNIETNAPLESLLPVGYPKSLTAKYSTVLTLYRWKGHPLKFPGWVILEGVTSAYNKNTHRRLYLNGHNFVHKTPDGLCSHDTYEIWATCIVFWLLKPECGFSKQTGDSFGKKKMDLNFCNIKVRCTNHTIMKNLTRV